MEISMLMTANSAEVREGNLYGLGMGWNWCQTPTPPCALVFCTLTTPSRVLAGPIEWQISLEDADGRVIFATQAGGQLDIPSTPGTQDTGAEIPYWSILPLNSMDLAPGRYAFRVRCDEAERSFAFRVVG